MPTLQATFTISLFFTSYRLIILEAKRRRRNHFCTAGVYKHERGSGRDPGINLVSPLLVTMYYMDTVSIYSILVRRSDGFPY